MLKISLRGHVWGLALSCIGLFFAHPVYSVMCVGTIRDRVLRLIFKPGCEMALFARDALGENNLLIMLVVGVLGVFLAFNGFSYLYNKSKVDMLHSIPAKRESLFSVEYIAGVLCYIVPYVVFMFLSLLIGLLNGMLDLRGVCSAFLMLFINLLGFLGLYNTSIIAILLTGNIAVGLMGTAVFLFYGIVGHLVFYTYRSVFFLTYSDYYNNDGAINYSPVSAYINLTDGMNSYTGVRDLKMGNIVLFAVFVIAGLALSLWLFKIRPSESAGRSIAFKKTMPVISVFLLVPAALVGGIMFEEFTSYDEVGYGWFIFGFLASLIIGHMVVQAIFHQDFKSLFKNLLNPLCGGVIAAVIAAVFMFDLTGYDSYIPKDDKYESAAIASYAMQGNVEYFDFDGETDEYGNRNIGQDLMDYRLDNIKLTDKALVRDFALAAIDDTKRFNIENTDDAESESEYYDDGQSTAYASVTVKYNMNNGKSIYRTYEIDLLRHIDIYDRLYADENYKDIACPMMTLSEEDACDICYYGTFGIMDTEFTKEDMKALVEAYREDVMEQDVNSLKTEIPYGFLYKSVAFEEDGYTGVYMTNKAYIYPSFERTIAILKKYDIDLNYYRDASNVNGIQITYYDETDENGSARTEEYTDEEDIAAILAKSYPGEFIYTEGALLNVESCDLTVSFKTTPYGYGTTIGYNMLAE